MSSQNNWNNPDMYYQQPQSGSASSGYDSYSGGYSSAQSGTAYPAVSYGSAGPVYQALPPTNTLSIIALIASIAGLSIFPVLAGIAGIVMGHIAKKQIQETGERGEGMAVASLWIGYIGTALWILGTIAYVLFMVLLFGATFMFSVPDQN